MPSLFDFVISGFEDSGQSANPRRWPLFRSPFRILCPTFTGIFTNNDRRRCRFDPALYPPGDGPHLE